MGNVILGKTAEKKLFWQMRYVRVMMNILYLDITTAIKLLIFERFPKMHEIADRQNDITHVNVYESLLKI